MSRDTWWVGENRRPGAISRLLFQVFEELNHRSTLTRLLFGVTVPVRTAQGHWDLTTLVLKKALAQHVTRGTPVLDVGTGEAGILGVYAACVLAVEVTAIDIDPEVVRGARAVAAENGVSVDFRCGDLLDGISDVERFGVIVFNPPYLPRAVASALGTSHQPPRVSDGGEDGLEVADRFLGQVGERAGRDTVTLLGVNTRYVSESRLRSAVHRHGLRVENVVRLPVNPARVFVLRRRAAGA